MKPLFKKNLLMIALIVLALMFNARGVTPVRAMENNPQAQGISPEGLLKPDGTLNLTGSFSGALDLDGWNVQVDPQRGPVFAPVSSAVSGELGYLNASVNGSLNSIVRAIVISGTDVYVGGSFYDVKSNGTVLLAADSIAKYDTLTGDWSALGSNGAGNGSLNHGVTSLAINGTDLYVGGWFTNVNNNGTVLPAADYIAKYDTLTGSWSALGSNGAGNGSLNEWVTTLTVSGTVVYVGGGFTNVNNKGTSLAAADYLAKWDGSNWSALGWGSAGNGSLNGKVNAIAVSGTDVYVGGEFSNVNNKGMSLSAADYIAKFDTLTGSWAALSSNGAGDGSLYFGDVFEIVISGTDLYVGGNFRDVNNNGILLTAADYIVKYDTLTGNWSALGSNGSGNGSLNDPVSDIAVSGANVYAVGRFTNANNNGVVLTAADRIAKWDGSNWSALGSNGAGDGSINYFEDFVSAIAVSGTDVYIGGWFSDVNNGGTSLPEADWIARWDTLTENWLALGSSGADGALNAGVRAIAISGTDVYVGGNFTNVNNQGTVLTAADYVAKWDGTNWSALGSNGAGDGSLYGGDGFGTVSALALSGTDLYVGGDFRDVNNNGTPLTAADFIAKYDILTGNWSALGSNGAGDGSLNNTVETIAISGTDLYVGGNFFDVNNKGTSLTAADHIARWDGSNWSALGSNGVGNGSITGTEQTVYAIAIRGTDVYVGGNFTNVNNHGTVLTAADYIAKWNGSNWSALGSNGVGNGSLNNTVFALGISGQAVYVGGSFTNINDSGVSLSMADYIAKWDGSNWSALGSNGAGDGSLNNPVKAIAVRGTNIYVGGGFYNVNNKGTSLSAADYVAQWNGSRWSALGSNGAGDGSFNEWVIALAVDGVGLYLGGLFTNVNDNGTIQPEADYIYNIPISSQSFVIFYATSAGTGNCSSWANACTLQTALSTAVSGDEIWVAAGTHTPTTGSDRETTFQLNDGVAVYGGFAGTETTRDQRDFETNLTILSGDLNGDDVGIANNSENSYHVITGATGAFLDGFTVRGGNADGTSPNDRGGGMFNNNSSPTLTNLIFDDNSADDSGGGMHNTSDSNPTLMNVAFSGNYSNEDGGGMSNYSSHPTLMNVTFSANHGYQGGGVSNAYGSAPTFTNVTFSDNWASDGGGMFNYGSNPELLNVTFKSNSASYGGGMVNFSSHPSLMNVTFNNNSAAIWGGGMYNVSNSRPTIRNTIFWGNTASNGGAQIYDNVSFSIVSDSIVQGGYTGGTNIITADPLLGVLGDYGGLTQTIPLLGGSSAIDSGSNTNCPAADQRGVTRPQGAGCDIGAYEVNVTFADVPATHWAWDWIERLYSAGITGGCASSLYCPEQPVTRAQMAIFLLRGIHGSDYAPPSVGDSTGFNDVPLTYWASAWIKQFQAEGITGGCGAGSYCPDQSVTRAQMAIFLLRAKHGSSYSPPDVDGSTGFGDVPTNHWAAAWIKQLAAEGITGGCGNGNYCPEEPVTRAQMAVFLVRAFGLP